MVADLLSLIKEIRDPIEPKVKTISFGGQAFISGSPGRILSRGVLFNRKPRRQNALRVGMSAGAASCHAEIMAKNGFDDPVMSRVNC
jgi:hypothetical protein